MHVHDVTGKSGRSMHKKSLEKSRARPLMNQIRSWVVSYSWNNVFFKMKNRLLCSTIPI